MLIDQTGALMTFKHYKLKCKMCDTTGAFGEALPF